jgi:hypothetical protein
MSNNDIDRAAAFMERLREERATNEFEDLLAHLQALHKDAVRSLADQPDEAKTLNAWFGVFLTISDEIRGAAIDSFRKQLFAPRLSGRRPSSAAALYNALSDANRRLQVLEYLMLLSRVTIACETLRRHSRLDEPSGFLCWAGAQSPKLVLPFARALVDWSTAARQHRQEQSLLHQRFREDGFRVIDVYGAFRALHLDADAAWLQLQAGGSPDATYERVLASYERCRAFLGAPVRGSWPLREFIECSATDTLADIVSGIVNVKKNLRLGVDADGRAMHAALRIGAAALKPLVAAVGADAQVRYVILLTNGDFFLSDYPSEDDIKRYERDPVAFLKKGISSIPTSQLARLIQIQINRVNHERSALRGLEKATDAGTAVLSTLIANAIAGQLGLSPEAKDVIQSILDSFVK